MNGPESHGTPGAGASFDFPLSWNVSETASEAAFKTLELPTGALFVHAAEIPKGMDAAAVRAKLMESAKDKPLLAQGFDGALADAFEAGGRVRISSSARIELAGYKPPQKVRNLANRAAKAEIRCEEADIGAAAKAQEALDGALRDKDAQVRYIFRERAEDSRRAFVARGPRGDVHALTALTRNGEKSWHTELLIRHPAAPDGAMEALIGGTAGALQEEGALRLDLGQVALFVPEEELKELDVRNRAFLASAPAVLAASGNHYNPEGLRRFKNKFEVTWVPRYFVAWPRVRWRDMTAFAHAAGLGQFVGLS